MCNDNKKNNNNDKRHPRSLFVSRQSLAIVIQDFKYTSSTGATSSSIFSTTRGPWKLYIYDNATLTMHICK